MNKKIILDQSIYPINVILQGIKDYAQVAEIRIVDQVGEKIHCEVICEEDNFRLIKNEYCNYLIALRSVMEC